MPTTPAPALTTGDRPLLGAFILFWGIIAVALMDVCAKLLGEEDMTVAQITWARFMFHFLTLLPFALMSARKNKPAYAAAARMWRRHLLRGALIAAASFSFFGAIQKNPVPDALAVFFVEPLFVALMARWFLGERASGRMLLAGAVGFVGVLVILRPGGDTDYHWTILLSLSAAVFFAGYIVSSRAASFNTPPMATSLYTAFFAMLLSLPAALYFWIIPDTKLLLMMILLGALAALGHTLIILSCRYASASLIGVLHYSEVAVAVLLSWLIFSHFPDIWVWAGVALILSAKILAIRAPRA